MRRLSDAQAQMLPMGKVRRTTLGARPLPQAWLGLLIWMTAQCEVMCWQP